MIPRQTWRDEWRQIVYREPSISNACRVLMLALADCMTADGQVRRSRRELAAMLGVGASRITERLNEAVEAGVLERVITGRPGQLALYAARRPDGACVRTKRRRNDNYIERRDMVGRSRPSDGARVRTKQGDDAERGHGPCVQVAISTSATTRPNVTERPASKPTTTKGAQAAPAAKNTRTPGQSGLSSRSARSGDPADRVAEDDLVGDDVELGLLDGKVSPEAAPRQHEAPRPEDYRHAHDVLAALAPERYQAVLERAREIDPDLDVPGLMLAAASIATGQVVAA